MSLDDHPVKQVIAACQFQCDAQGNPIDFIVGQNCTRIEACSKDGEFCSLPYLRVWSGDSCMFEAVQHKASFVRFSPEKLPTPDSNNLPF